MARYTVKCVDAKDEIFDIVTTDHYSEADKISKHLIDSGFDSWVCDNLQEILVG